MSQPTRNDAAFFTPHWDEELLYTDPVTGFRVYRAGEMRIETKDAQGRPVTIRTTNDLDAFGITNDAELAAREGDPTFDWVNNAWFEVVGPENEGEEGEVFAGYEEAVAAAAKGVSV